MNITLHIERLVLEGINLPTHQGPLLQAAVEAELVRLLAGRGLAAGLHSGGALPAVRGEPIRLTPNAAPVQLGQQIAQAIYSGIGAAEPGPKGTSSR